MWSSTQRNVPRISNDVFGVAKCNKLVNKMPDKVAPIHSCGKLMWQLLDNSSTKRSTNEKLPQQRYTNPSANHVELHHNI